MKKEYDIEKLNPRKNPYAQELKKEQLIVYALLSSIGLDYWLHFQNKLDELYMNNKDDLELLELEGMDKKDAILHTLSLINNKIDLNIFGRFLMEELKKIYKECNDLFSFTWKLFELSSHIPNTNIRFEQPFNVLDIANDELGIYGEDKCKELLEYAFNYYDNK